MAVDTRNERAAVVSLALPFMWPPALPDGSAERYGLAHLFFNEGVAPEPEDDAVTGGWLSPEQARAVLRKVHRRRADKARRAEELHAAIEEAREAELAGAEPSEAIAPVLRIVERDTGAIMLPALASLSEALERMAAIDQQIAAMNIRRTDDAVAVMLLMEI